MVYKLSDSWNVGILVFLVMLGILVALLNKAGGSAAFGKWASKHIKTMMMTEEEFLARARVVDDRCVDDEDFDYDLDPDVMIG